MNSHQIAQFPFKYFVLFRFLFFFRFSFRWHLLDWFQDTRIPNREEMRERRIGWIGREKRLSDGGLYNVIRHYICSQASLWLLALCARRTCSNAHVKCQSNSTYEHRLTSQGHAIWQCRYHLHRQCFATDKAQRNTNIWHQYMNLRIES